MLDRDSLIAKLSVAGIWHPIDSSYITASYNGLLASTFYGNIALGPEQRQGLVVTGWAYTGNSAGPDALPVNLAILAQQPDGSLALATTDFVSDPHTNGGGSVIVTDFNGDGAPDIFLAPYNETPFIGKASTVLLSNLSGTFDKQTLADHVIAHDVELARVAGVPTVVTETFPPGDTDPVYQFDPASGGFTQAHPPHLQNSGGQSIAVGDFNGDGHTEAAIGDFFFGPGVPYSPSNPHIIAMYKFENGDITGTPLDLITPYFNSRPQYAGISSFYGPGQAHTYRLLVDDFNHDGKADLIGEESLWSGSSTTYPATLQMLQNQGNFTFADVTDTLNPDYNVDGQETDYTPQLVDLDGSGINSLLLGSEDYGAVSRQSNYLLVNDGTGRLYVALHDQFVQMGSDVNQYLSVLSQSGSLGLNVFANQLLPRFRGYVTPDGKVNFEAEVSGGKLLSPGVFETATVFVNVPLQYDLTTDFTQDITITDRNGSHLIRTFAGNDTIYAGNDGGHCHIDGGLGQDTVIYTGNSADYTVIFGNGAWTVTDGRSGSPDGTDTLQSIETLQFADRSINLPCFAGGTRIATAGGDVPVEMLKVGDVVRLASGDSTPIVWIGHRTIDCSRHAAPRGVWPVRIRRHAFGPDRPRCEIRLSPDHAVFVDGMLIPVRYLIDGSTIVQEQCDTVEYFHLELPRHDVLLAEGLPVESYLDTGDRVRLTNGGGAVALHPDFASRHWETHGCAPLVITGAELAAVRSYLAERVAHRGSTVMRAGGCI